MHYIGGKARIAGVLSDFLNKKLDITPNNGYIEPFVGGVWVLEKINSKIRIASDINEDLILLFRALQNGWEPPEYVSEDEYRDLKTQPPSPLRAFVGIGCSWGGKWFGGYARSGSRNYAKNARNSLLRKADRIRSVSFFHCDYTEYLSIPPKGFVIYCDPPYTNSTQGYSSNKFDSDTFWESMRILSLDNWVYISEYLAPDDFECVLKIPTKTDLRISGGRKEARMEKVFSYSG